MDVLTAIRERRATRSFQPRQVEESDVRALLDAAIQAPSARNAQPWSFAVVQDRAFLARLSQAALKRLAADPYWRMSLSFDDAAFDIFYHASTLIIICAHRDGFNPVGDCYLAAQNLMLAAHAMGLATCPIGLVCEELRSEAVRQELALPFGVAPALPIVVGYPEHSAEAPARKPPTIHAWLR